MKRKTISHLVRELIAYRTYLWYETLGRLKMRHKGSVLGYLWWVLDPVLFLMVYYTVFKVILKRGEENFVLFLFCGLLPWRWFTTSVSEGSLSIRSVGGLLKQVYFPKVIPPVTAVLVNTVNFLTGVVLLILLAAFYRTEVGWNTLYFPLVAIVQFTFAVGLTMVLAHIGVYFKDIKTLQRYILQMWFYMSPILYSASWIPEPYRDLYQLNPFAIIITSYRDTAMFNRPPDFVGLSVVMAVGLVLSTIGLKILALKQGNYAKVL